MPLVYFDASAIVKLNSPRNTHSGAPMRVHLASALAVCDPNLVVAVWDRRLHAGVVSAGLAVAPAVRDT